MCVFLDSGNGSPMATNVVLVVVVVIRFAIDRLQTSHKHR